MSNPSLSITIHRAKDFPCKLSSHSSLWPSQWSHLIWIFLSDSFLKRPSFFYKDVTCPIQPTLPCSYISYTIFLSLYYRFLFLRCVEFSILRCHSLGQTCLLIPDDFFFFLIIYPSLCSTFLATAELLCLL